MANRPAAPRLLREGDRQALQRLVRSTSARAGLAQRASIILLAADGFSNTKIAKRGEWIVGHRARFEDF